MKSIPVKLTSLAFLLLVFSCQSEPPQSVALCEVCDDQYKKKNVIIEGIIKMPNQFITGGVMQMWIKTTPKCNTRTPILGFRNVKGGKNSMKFLPTNYTSADIKITDNSDQAIIPGDKVKVTGTMIATSKAWCQINVEKIEKL